MATINDLKNSAKEIANAKIADKTAMKKAKKVLQEKKDKEVFHAKVVHEELVEVINNEHNGDEMLLLEADQELAKDLKAIDLKYEPKFKELSHYDVETFETAGLVLAVKATEKVAPVTRGIAMAGRTAISTLFGTK